MRDLKIKLVGKFYQLEKNVCDLGCDCGWNLKIGGSDKKDLDNILEYLENYGKEE